MEKEKIKILKMATEKWGKNAQILMALEEMAELSKELLKNMNRNSVNKNNITEEMADVYILLEQLKTIYGILEDDINNIVEEKINKLEIKLKNNENI